MDDYVKDYILLQLKNLVLVITTMIIWLNTKTWMPFYRVLFTVIWIPICGRGLTDLLRALGLYSKTMDKAVEYAEEQYFEDE